MWKVLLADDEALIVKGLRRLIDWASLEAEIVAEATDGDMALERIEQFRPDLVISDIRMPKLTGLEIMAHFQDGEYSPKFIFVSGYEEFEYARQALSGGAVDYLLKPVSAEALEKAVRKALGILERSSSDLLFQQPTDEINEFFAQLSEDRETTGGQLREKFLAMLKNHRSPVFRGLCLGLRSEDEQRLRALPYERQLLRRFMVYNSSRDLLERGGHACFLQKDEGHCWLMGIFEPGESVEVIVRETVDSVAQRTGFRLRAGVGRECSGLEELSRSHQDSLRAYDLYYFRQEDILFWKGPAAPSPKANERIDQATKEIFELIVAKSDQVLDRVGTLLDDIAAVHWGNRTAAYNRVMVFTGDLCQLLFANRLLEGDFNQRQDELQRRLEDQETFQALRTALLHYYRELLSEIYLHTHGHVSQEIMRVLRYIEEHYDQDLSLKSLAEIACVSPSYFSAYFKAETRQNYKAYLTQVRMERAMELVIGSDLKTYEIAERVGYNNVRRFVDAFRSAYRMSPLDYRKLHRK